MTNSVQNFRDLIAEGRLLKTSELAHALNISRHGLYLLIRTGEVRVVRLGNSFRIPAAEARRLMTVPDVPNRSNGSDKRPATIVMRG